MATKKELEARIKELESQNAILTALAKNVRSDPSDCDLVSSVGKVTVLYKMYGGFAISTKQFEWEDMNTFEQVIERISQLNQGE